MIGWARMVVCAGVGTAVATGQVYATTAALLLASAWYFTWTFAETHIDVRFGLLVGYAPLRHRRWRALQQVLLDTGDPEALMEARLAALGQMGQQARHARPRARARRDSRRLLPRQRSSSEVVDV